MSYPSAAATSGAAQTIRLSPATGAIASSTSTISSWVAPAVFDEAFVDHRQPAQGLLEFPGLVHKALADRPGLGALALGRPVTIFLPSQAREQPGRLGFCIGHCLAAGPQGERQEERIELRIGAGKVPFDSVQGSSPAQGQPHLELRKRAAEPSDPLPPLDMGCQITSASFACEPPLSLAGGPRRAH